MNALFVDLLPVVAVNGSLLKRRSAVQLVRFLHGQSETPCVPRLRAISAIASWSVRSHMCEHLRHQVSGLDRGKGSCLHNETGANRGDLRE
jgi:hypothetical protein